MGVACWWGFNKGDLIVFSSKENERSGYEHWAVYVGWGNIIHYQSVEGLKTRSEIIKESLKKYYKRRGMDCIAKKGELHSEFKPLGPWQVVKRAESRVGDRGYNLIWNNCEHFAKWCKYGVKMSDQVETVGAVTVGGVSVVVGTTIGGVLGTAMAGPVGTVIGGICGGAGGWIIGVMGSYTFSSMARRRS